MATQLIAAGTTAANSSDIVVASGATLTVALKAQASDATAFIELKDDGGAYNIVGSLNFGAPALSIVSPGTYRVRRRAGGSCGVFSA
jgi:hypothetical protein